MRQFYLLYSSNQIGQTVSDQWVTDMAKHPFREFFEAVEDGRFQKAERMSEPDRTGQKQEYAGILVYYLDRQLKKYEN